VVQGRNDPRVLLSEAEQKVAKVKPNGSYFAVEELGKK